DRRFHLTIAKLSGNPFVEFFVQQIGRMRCELPRVTEVYARVCHDDGASRADEHMAIFDALRARDPVAARNAMRHHFQRLFEAMLPATESQALEEIRRRTQQDRE
ncbi:FCD domain-containing protein, partial [Mesorhizobium sp. M4B.F.Ca.ET.211.01.1.1]|uniref:FadR/GntR family transcriptional regulator n=1 Tax=Mesorhizobium sp. M4B.F.Ca.ET.211.01.1.1 TaxID=2563954 RepID=UPI0010918A94